MHYIITYDIANDKRRTKLADLLGKYGTRVNYSVFECELNERKRESLLHTIEIQKLLNKKYDSLRFYHLCKNCMEKSFDVCNREEPFNQQELFI